MGKLLNYLCIFSVLFAVSLSLRDNNTSVKKTTEGEAEGWSWPGWGQVFGGRQASVFLTDVYNYLREAVWNYGTLKFVVWNRTPNELNEGKWKAKHLAVEAPVPLFIESKKRPVVVSSHYHQRLTWNNPHSLWVSYRISENSRCRICIYGKLEYGWFHFKSPPKLKYAVYITDENDCDEDKKLKSIIFVHENYQNGYNYSKQNGVTAKSAFETHGLNHVLNVYILDFHVEEKKEKQERNKESSSNINMQQQQGTEKIEKNNQSKTKQNGKNSQSKTKQNGKNSQSKAKQNGKNSQSKAKQQRSHGVDDETVQQGSSQPKKNRKRSVVKKIESVMKVLGKNRYFVEKQQSLK